MRQGRRLFLQEPREGDQAAAGATGVRVEQGLAVEGRSPLAALFSQEACIALSFSMVKSIAHYCLSVSQAGLLASGGQKLCLTCSAHSMCTGDEC